MRCTRGQSRRKAPEWQQSQVWERRQIWERKGKGQVSLLRPWAGWGSLFSWHPWLAIKPSKWITVALVASAFGPHSGPDESWPFKGLDRRGVLGGWIRRYLGLVGRIASVGRGARVASGSSPTCGTVPTRLASIFPSLSTSFSRRSDK